jgi:hypothetical protein
MAKNNTLRNAGKAFTTNEEAILLSSAGLLPATQIALKLGRTVKAVRRKAEKFGLLLTVK